MKIARIGDKVNGSCRGSYEYTTCGKTTCWTSTSSENGYIAASISKGSHNVFCNGKAIARVGDDVDIHKKYPNSGHLDNLNIIGHIVSGSETVFCNGKPVAWQNGKIEASGCSNVSISEGSHNVFNNK